MTFKRVAFRFAFSMHEICMGKMRVASVDTIEKTERKQNKNCISRYKNVGLL